MVPSFYVKLNTHFFDNDIMHVSSDYFSYI